MKIRIIYIITVVLILATIGITAYYNLNYSVPEKCPDSCGNWIYGSCIGKQLYMERECHNYTDDCIRQTYFDRKIENVEACSQTDCQEGISFSNYKCA